MVSEIPPLEKETSPEKTQEKMERMAKAATAIIQNTSRKLERKVNQIEVDHDSLSWTACYDDVCQVHLSDKEGKGWFPKRPRPRKVYFSEA